MNKQGMRRIISLLLAVMMVCTLLPTAAFAEGTAESEPVQQTGAPGSAEETPAPAKEGKVPAAPEGEDGKKDEVQQPEGEKSQEPAKDETPANEANGIATYASNSTVVLHPSVSNTVAGVKVSVGDTIDGHRITSISGYDITVDLGKYNVNNDTFRLPYAKDIWSGVDNNKVDYISWAGSGSTRRSEGASALLANGKNTAYYYFKGAPALLLFTLNYDANGGTGAPASQTYKATSEYEKSHSFTISSQVPTREGYTFLGWSTNPNATTADRQPGGSIVVTGTTTLYAVWETKTPPQPDKPGKPTEDDIINNNILGDVTVECTNADVQHGSRSYPLTKESITSITEPVYDSNAGQYSCMVTVSSTGYVHQFDRDKGGVHTPDDKTKTIQLLYYADAWHGPSGDPSVSSILFKVACTEKPEPPKAPDAPSHDELSKLIGDITVNCTNEAATHDPKSKSYALISGSYTTSEVEGNAENGYTCTVTVNAQKYVEQFDTDTSAAHDPKDATATVTLKHTDNCWTVTGGTPVVFNVACVTEIVPPPKPDDEKLGELDAAVKVVCTTKPDKHETATFALRKGTYEIGKITGNETDGYFCDITVTADEYVALYNTDLGKHTLTGDSPKTLTLKYVEGQWAVDTPVTFPVECEIAPEKPTPPTDEIGGATVAVKCITGHGDLSWKIGSSTFTVGEVTGDDTTGYTCTVTVQAEVYVNAFNSNKKANGVKHTLADDAEKTFTMTYVNGAWTGPTNPAVTFEVKCEEELVPVQVVIYRNGDTTTPYKTVSLGKQPKGTVLDLTALNIGDYYTANYTGRYDFYGWYNDGGWNDYKNNTANPPAGLTEIKVNGWTNIKCMVYDYEKVVYFQSAEALAAYQGDHSKTEGLLYSTTVRKGSELPTADAPAAARAGYHFLFWSREGQTGDVTGQTVDGWTNLYANWEKNTYTVTYTDGVDGEEVFADQVYTAKFEDATPAFEGTPVRKGYVFLGWDPEVAETVTGNATYTAKWKLDMPTREMILETLGKIRVECVKDGSGHAVKEYAASVGGYTAVTMGDRDGRYTVTVTIPAGMYVDQYGLDTEMDHYLAAGEQAEKKVVLEYYNSEWKIVSGTLPVTFKVTCQTYTVTYTDGVEDEEVFADQVYTDLLSGAATPKFNGTPTRKGYVFGGWNPTVAETVTANATYVATWKVDANNNGIPDDEEEKYTVTYTDGVENEEVFADQVYADLLSGTATPKFNGTPTRKGYVFAGWNPAVAETVTANATYVATWKVDANNNGIPDDEEEKYTVIYTDGVNGAAFADQVYEGLLSGDVTPRFNGTPTRKGYTFNGWSPKVANNVTKSVTYTATWKAVSSSVKDGKDSVAKTGDSGIVLVLGGVMLFSLCGAVAVSVYDRKRKQG